MGARTPSVLYRYFLYGWLFRDAGSGTAAERFASLRHNREQARWLPTYMRRWLVVTAANIGVAAVLEKALAAMLSAAFFYTNGCIAVCVLAVTVVGWVFLGTGDVPPARS